MIKIQISDDWKPSTEVLIIPIIKNNVTLDKMAPLTPFSSTDLGRVFKGEKNEIQVLFTNQQNIILLGLGNEKMKSKDVIKAFRKLSHHHKGKLTNQIGLYLKHFDATKELTEYALNGLLLGTYKVGHFKTEEKKQHPLEDGTAKLNIYTSANRQETEKAAQKGVASAETQMSIFGLVNAPANKKTPQVLAKWAKASAEKYGYSVDVWDKAKIKEVGLHALLAVNRGSEDPPHFIIMEYKGANATKKVGLVGKGVTFDTGGISIKGANNMHLMKSDMGGAAAVLGTVELSAKLQLPIHLIGIVPTTDNSVDALAIKPSDVIDTYSGKTIEIIDTDAEGRLILSDGLAYMVRHFEPDVLIDLATLTGSAVRTLGYHAAALFSKNEELSAALQAAGEKTGEKVWSLPLWEEYFDALKSDVADIRNLGTRPVAGAIAAAKFLEFFTNKHPAWAHLDIAGVAFSDMEFSKDRSSTAYGVRLLVEYLSHLS
ncbi:MAG: leucyl aminopeptidase [Bacteroidota bacterium]